MTRDFIENGVLSTRGSSGVELPTHLEITYWGGIMDPFDPDDLYEIIERLIQLAIIAVAVVAAVVIAAWLAGPVANAIFGIPQALGRFGRFLWSLTSVPWQNWLVFPFVFAFVLLAFWFLARYEEGEGKPHLRGRRMLSSKEAQRIAARQAGAEKSQKLKPGRPY
jgi:hypothetical protein